MKILLINHNPVVSRLTSLSAKKEKVELDEIKDISAWEEKEEYDIVFVDSESYSNPIADKLNALKIRTSVFFYAQGEEEHQELFSHTILKPFLPSEVSAILRETKIARHQEVINGTPTIDQSHTENATPSVNFEELIDSQVAQNPSLNLELKEPTTSTTSQPLNSPATKAHEMPKEENKTESPSQDSFDLKLEEAFPLSAKEDSSPQEKEPIKASSVENSEQKKETHNEIKESVDPLDLKLFESDTTPPAVQVDEDQLFSVDQEIKENILGDDTLAIDLESTHEVNFDEAPTTPPTKTIKSSEHEKESQNKTTKILDQDEISSIKSLLEDDTKLTDENLTLDDIITPTISPETQTDEPKPSQEPALQEKSSHKSNAVVPTEERNTSEILAQTLGKLPVHELRELLRGATVNISIQFPNEL